MRLSRHRKHPKAPAAPPSPSVPVPTPAPAGPPLGAAPAPLAPHRRTALWVALAVAVVWWAVLFLLVSLTSNPVVLNLRQIESSDALVTARIVDVQAGRVEVERDWQLHPQWVAPVKPGPIVVEHLSEARGVLRGDRYLIPLSNLRGRYAVTPVAGVQPTPVVYPATPETEQALAQALEELKSRPPESTGRQ